MKQKNRHIPRTFFPGESWFFMKIYGGIYTCDRLLVEVIYPAVKALLDFDIVKRWFFIRFTDPEFHLRVRLELSDTDKMPLALQTFNKRLLPLCRNRQLFRIVIDTYEREIERYGKNTMTLSESLFDVDSHCICLMLKHLFDQNRGSERWKVAFVWIDATLNAMGFDINKKWEIMDKMSKAYLNEFGYNLNNIKPMAAKYRQLKSTISKLLVSGFDDEINHVIASHVTNIREKVLNVDVEQLNLWSLLHMSMNRLFESKNRFNELVLYYCLERYYKSSIKQMKSIEI